MCDFIPASTGCWPCDVALQHWWWLSFTQCIKWKLSHSTRFPLLRPGIICTPMRLLRIACHCLGFLDVCSLCMIAQWHPSIPKHKLPIYFQATCAFTAWHCLSHTTQTLHAQKIWMSPQVEDSLEPWQQCTATAVVCKHKACTHTIIQYNAQCVRWDTFIFWHQGCEKFGSYITMFFWRMELTLYSVNQNGCKPHLSMWYVTYNAGAQSKVWLGACAVGLPRRSEIVFILFRTSRCWLPCVCVSISMG